MRIAAIAFLGGILLVQQLPKLPSLWLGCLLAPLIWLAWNRPRLIAAPAFIAGVFWSSWHANAVLQQQLPVDLIGQDIQIEGTVSDIPKSARSSTRFRFQVDRAHYQGQAVIVPQRLLLRFYHKQHSSPISLYAGDRWSFTVRLKRPHGFQNPGGFDYEGYLFRQQIRATGYVRLQPSPERLPRESRRYTLNQWRQQLGERIENQVRQKELAGMMIALANGNRDRVKPHQWQRMRKSGTNHLVAISGLHIGLIAGLAFFLARHAWACSYRLPLLCPAQKAAAVVAMLVATFYAAMAGFSVPTQRALIMLACIMGAIIYQRRILFSKLLAFALFIVLLLDPLAAIDFGFWLSFSAVAVIGYSMQSHGGYGGWRKLVHMQWAIALGLFPLMLLLFQFSSLVAPLTNLVAVPVFGFLIVPLVLVGSAFAYIAPSWSQNIFLESATWLLKQLWILLDAIIAWGPDVWISAAPPWWIMACSIIGIALLLAPKALPGRWLGMIWIAPLFLVNPPGPAKDELWLTLLDVGQGLSVIVQTHNQILVYDTGPRFGNDFDTGEAVVLPFLRSQGISVIDQLLISHGDNDHIGGAQSVLKEMPVLHTRTSVPHKLDNAEVCMAGQQWQWGSVEFFMLAPNPMHGATSNNASCVIRISSRYGSVLLPGDIEAQAEKALVRKYGETLASDILIVPHHGSKTSSSDIFLDSVKPRFALIPAGYRNRYGHPHPRILERYRQRGIPTYVSAKNGAIQIRFTKKGSQVARYRSENQRYWFNF